VTSNENSITTNSGIKRVGDFLLSIRQRANDQTSVTSRLAQIQRPLDSFEGLSNRLICKLFNTGIHTHFSFFIRPLERKISVI
jgi:hypothetical protein